MSFKMPGSGFVFWPVGCGDTTTIVIDDQTVMQLDLHHVEASDDDADPRWPVVDHLVAELPKKNGLPYLAAFILTHLDQDHVKGFAELNRRVHIGEIWFTPRALQELEDDADMCEDAEAFCKEARRRIGAVTAGKTESGDRIRVIGWSEILQEGDFAKIPNTCKTIPGNDVTIIDGVDKASKFRAFIHAPFKDDAERDRNGTSIGMQVTLRHGIQDTKVLLLGDLDHDPIKRIFDQSEDDDVAWNILLAPHHCSKSALYEKRNDIDVLDEDLLSAIDAAGCDDRWIVSSSVPIPARNLPGDNPPHAKAKNRYQSLVNDGCFLCTGEHPDTAATSPIIFSTLVWGLHYEKPESVASHTSGVVDAIAFARGGDAPHGTTVGFGRG